MKSKLKKVSFALAGVMSAVAIAGVVPKGTVAFLPNMATVANAASWGSINLNGDQVINESVAANDYGTIHIGNNGKCVIIINGNLDIGEYCYIFVHSESILVVNGNVHLKEFAQLRNNGTVILTGEMIQDGYNAIETNVVKDNIPPNIGYVAENDEHYEYFTSGDKIYTFNGSTFVEQTAASVAKSAPATATYAQVGEDYPAAFSGDTAASLWKVTVTPGTDTIENIDVKVNNKGSDQGAWNGMNITNGTVVFGVAVNLVAADVNSVTAVVNGDDVATTAVVE